MRYIYPLKRNYLPRHVGEKSKNLHYLNKQGFSIPIAYAISWNLQRVYLQNGELFPESFCNALERVIDPEKTYAIRSSANVEDSQTHSYAGQFLSVLDVSGLDDILNAIKAVWNSSNLESPNTYRSYQGSYQDKVEMGVLIQEMIPASLSGVAFSRNPITGMDEIVIEAVEGSSIAFLQDGITPMRWIWKWGKWVQQPEHSNIPLDLIQEIVEQVLEISSKAKKPVDTEWVFDGQRVVWVQMRAITALQGIDIYSNHIPKEFLPGVIKPLVWTVNIPLVNGAWVRLLTEILGENQLDPLRLARSFYGYAYFNMGLLGSVFQKIGLPDNALERLMGFDAEGSRGPSFRPSYKALRYLPRIMKFSVEKILFDRKFLSFLAQAKQDYAELEAQFTNASTDMDMVNHIGQIFTLNQETSYFNIIIPILMQLYHQYAKWQLARWDFDYESINWLENWDDRNDYDPLPYIHNLGVLYQDLNPEDRKALMSGQGELSGKGEAFKRNLKDFMDRFGHLSDSGNDFSFPSWEDTPEVVITLISGSVNNPFPGKIVPGHNSADVLALKSPLLKRAIRYSRYREQISFLYTRGFSMFRRAYKRIGKSFSDLGWIDNIEDIFFLEHDEIVDAIKQGHPGCSLTDLVQKRKVEHNQFELISPPPIIYGEHPPPIVDNKSVTLTGNPTSRGLHRGIVRVVKTIGDFPKVIDDCVLVIPYSDVSWTPLFTRAGALVAEAGGMLSHSSIVARELGIPAIVSVENATRLKDDIEVTVDGFTGKITLHDTPSMNG